MIIIHQESVSYDLITISNSGRDMMVAILTPVLGAATAVLALASGRNMWQAYSICHAHDREDGGGSCPSIGNVSSQEEVLSKLQSMPKSDLLKLFLSSEPPASHEESIKGEWNGILLHNNLVLTTVTNFITNTLFGMGRKWNGKAFYEENKGINRFHAKADSSSIQTEHRFDFSIAPSRLDPKSSSVILIYNKYQNLFSPWKAMVDELRVLKLPQDSSVEVMICMGCMGWSGGMLNASPFCLWRPKRREATAK